MPNVSRITVYPIKSLDGHELTASAVLSAGALAGDRRYALVDNWGRFVNGKRCPAIHTIRATFSDDLQNVILSRGDQEDSFEIAAEQERLANWCGDVLDVKCRLVDSAETGFPDDPVSTGPTLVSTASLETVATWFDGLTLSEARRRLRFNLEVAETPDFWEDSLVPALRKLSHFRIGKFVWQGRGVCERCVVPTRDSTAGSVTAGFAREFARRREQSLPAWAAHDRFEHFYRLGVNTILDADETGRSGMGSLIRLGDQVERLG